MYNTLYNFTEKPFNVTPDPTFLYLTESHKEALASMMYGINERKGFISITGEVGTGKTTLIHTLLGNLNEKVKTVFIFHTNTTFEQLLKNILHELDIPVNGDDKITLLHKLNDYLIKRLSKDETLTIIIDEAQNLPKEVMEELRMLSNLETSKSKLLQILLVGQPELEMKLNSEDLRQLKQRIGIRRQIKPLSREESRKYIDHRLNLVGSSSKMVFSSEALSLICTYARGIPRVINVLCDNAFLIGYSESKKRINAHIVREVIKDMEHSSPDPIKMQAEHEKTPVMLPSLKVRPHYHRFAVPVLSTICVGLLILLGRDYFQSSPPEASKVTHAQNPYLSSSIEPSCDRNKLASELSTDTVSDNDPFPQEREMPFAQPLQSFPVAVPELQNTQKNEERVGGGKEEIAKNIITVQAGDSIFYLLRKHYGMVNVMLVDLVLEANPEITNAHLIKVDQHMRIPKITKDLLINKIQDNRYKIHVGTFQTSDSAYQYAHKLSKIGKEVNVIPREISPGDTWYRVVLGDFETREESLENINILKEKGLLTFITSEENSNFTIRT
ncbi:MAG: AAA family ATPase [Deltaproteobacteria bacterium]|nr:AAA family ATPase [Deltaproteobacteria bacterium]